MLRYDMITKKGNPEYISVIFKLGCHRGSLADMPELCSQNHTGGQIWFQEIFVLFMSRCLSGFSEESRKVPSLVFPKAPSVLHWTDKQNMMDLQIFRRGCPRIFDVEYWEKQLQAKQISRTIILGLGNKFTALYSLFPFVEAENQKPESKKEWRKRPSARTEVPEHHHLKHKRSRGKDTGNPFLDTELYWM